MAGVSGLFGSVVLCTGGTTAGGVSASGRWTSP